MNPLRIWLSWGNDFIIAAGSTGGFNSRLATVRLGPNGAQDVTFGDDGWALTSIENTFNGIRGIALDGGFIYAAGFGADQAFNYKMILAKYFNQNPVSGVNSPNLLAIQSSVYPNPAKNEIILTLEGNLVSEYEISLQNAQGQTFGSFPTFKSNGDQSQEMRLEIPEGIPSGMYWLTIFNKDGIQTLPLMLKK